MRPRTLLAASLAVLVVACGDDAPVAERSPQPPVAVAAPSDVAVVEPPPAPSPSPSPTPSPDPRHAELADALASLVAHPAFHIDGGLGIAVLDDESRLVFEHHGQRALMPASTMKIVPVAAALTALGADHRYRTTVRATAPVVDGVLDGDLVLVGSGDPALATPLFDEEVWPDRPDTEMADLAGILAGNGLQEVTGDILGDPTIFTDENRPSGWLDEYLYSLDATYSSGLTVNAGRRLERKGGRLHGIAVPDPAAEAAARLKGLLEQRGVTVAGRAMSTRTPPTGEIRAQIAGPPLSRLARWTIQHSDNHMADALFRTVGAEVLGDGSWAGAERAVQQVLDLPGIDWTGTELADGSGLSRDNRISALALARIDAAMTAGEHAAAWREAQAVAGESGTLRRRLRGTLADGAFRGKTGTLDDVRSMVGAIEGPGGRYHLAIIGNAVRGDEIWRVRGLTDELILRLAEDLHGCRRESVPSPSPTATPAPPSYRVVCR